MKLLIRKDQSSGVFGGTKFEFTAKVALTTEETELVNKYKAAKQVLMKKEVKIPFTTSTFQVDITIGSLIQGQAFKCNDIGEILECENTVKESCANFKNYLQAMKEFGGQEEFEY
jgi:hypothetical protein